MVDAGYVLGFLANGVVFGSILAVGSIGLSLVYGILSLSNFAHGDFLTLAAFLSLLFAFTYEPALSGVGLIVGALLVAYALVDRFVLRRLSALEWRVLLGFGLVLLLVFVPLQLSSRLRGGAVGRITSDWELLGATLLALTALAGVLVGLEFAIWRPLRRRKATVLTLIIVSIGLALVLRNALLWYFGGGVLGYNRPIPEAPVYLGARVSYAAQFAFVVTVLLVVALHLFLKFTRTGKAMRALSDNVELARITGIDVDRVIVHTWIISGVLTGIAGVLYSLVQTNTMYVNMGFSLLIPLFAAVILGGIGNAYGAVLGGFLVGIAMKTTPLVMGPLLGRGSEYEMAMAFAILGIVLLVRPQGILGGKVR